MKPCLLVLLLTITGLQSIGKGDYHSMREVQMSANQFGYFIKTIRYKYWDGSRRSADLENIHWINGPFGVWNVSDPDFLHHAPDEHQSDYIDYLSDIGEKWRSKCHAHSNISGDVWFTFEHFREGNENDKHEDNILNYQTWEGRKAQISIRQRNVDNNPADEKDIGTSDPKEIMFMITIFN